MQVKPELAGWAYVMYVCVSGGGCSVHRCGELQWPRRPARPRPLPGTQWVQIQIQYQIHLMNHNSPACGENINWTTAKRFILNILAAANSLSCLSEEMRSLYLNVFCNSCVSVQMYHEFNYSDNQQKKMQINAFFKKKMQKPPQVSVKTSFFLPN